MTKQPGHSTGQVIDLQKTRQQFRPMKVNPPPRVSPEETSISQDRFHALFGNTDMNLEERLEFMMSENDKLRDLLTTAMLDLIELKDRLQKHES